VIEGRFGFLYAHCGERSDADAVVDRLGEHWELPGIFFKPYPCNHFTHAGIDAALEIRSRGIDPADIESIELGVPSPVLRTIAQPAEAKARPESGYHAAFSGPYTVAAALTGGGGLGLGHEDFTDAAAADEERLALAAKVTCVADARADEIFPHQFPAVLTVRLADGTEQQARVDVNRGGPGNPLTSEELATKFTFNAEAVLDPAAAQELSRAVLALPGADGLGPVMEMVRR
ncbi:MAG: MmgE/PrpD family protein, partial [Actinomycetales bacterium]|nr:MmgE/PrpD family protein [Actinomycetales bacterium]